MRITTINIPKEYLEDGLEEVKLDRIGKIILIAGKNGSGKTRLLNNIKRKLQRKITIKEIEDKKSKISNHQKEIEKLNDNIKKIEDGTYRSVFPKKPTKETFLNQIMPHERDIINLYSEINVSNCIMTTNENNKPKFIEFVPKELKLSDPIVLSKSHITQAAGGVKYGGTQNMSAGTLPLIQLIQERQFRATHPDSPFNEILKKQSQKDFDDLFEIISKVLNISISSDIDGNTTINDMLIGKAKLSDGQVVLLQFCIAIYAQRSSLEEMIIFMDEPENHLHPSALIEVTDRLQQCVTNGQIWIATHSIPLLAHFDTSNIYYMEDNKVSYAGDAPEKVLEGLLGDENEIARLQDFTNLPAIFALNKYAFECLFEPAVLMTGKTDPQNLQIKANLQHLMKDGKLKVLDYGAGKGRLLANIIDSLEGDTKEFIAMFDYIAFDKYQEDKDDCIKSIEAVYGNADKRYFNDLAVLLSNHDTKSFNVVIMCNVLHEIDPKDWLNLFKKDDGQITNLLSENGILLHVEDTLIPTGEKAFQNGFIVLDTPQVKELFCIKQEEDKRFIVDTKKDDRLKAHQIPKECLERISTTSRKDALKSISNLAKEKIRKLRNEDRNYKNGKKHAYWVQQLANTELALSEM